MTADGKPKDQRLTIWYHELEGADYPYVGKKNANLGEMMKAGIPASPGFALTIHANDRFMSETGIKQRLDAEFAGLDDTDLEACQRAGERTVELIMEAEIPTEIADDALRQYATLCRMTKVEDVPVAVRSSGAVSMPGQMETYLNIRGRDDLLHYIKKTWASAYHVEAITYRLNKGMGFLLNIGVGVPKMVNSALSGVIFTLNPLNGDRSKISVDISYGLGEAVVSGLVTPDNILVDKITLTPIRTVKGSKGTKYVYNSGCSDICLVDVTPEDRGRLCVSTEELQELCRVAKRIDTYYGTACDIEFGIDADLPFPDNVIVLQVRPESVWSKKAERAPHVEDKKDAMDRVVGQLLHGVRLS